MLVLLSPSKTQDFESKAPTRDYTQPVLLEESSILIKELRKQPVPALRKLMTVSEKIAALNHTRYRKFHLPFTLANAKQALFAFQGDVYDGLNAAGSSPAFA